MRINDHVSLTHYLPGKAYNGFTLFTPTSSTVARLIDMQGRFVQCWETPWQPGAHGQLLENGNLLYAAKDDSAPFAVDFNGAGGIIVEYDWDGKEVWKYEDEFMHHDIQRLPNGNTMVVRWVAVPDDIAEKIEGGVPGTERKGVIWGECLHEVDPKGKVVWEWIAHDHLDVKAFPICPLCGRHEWLHVNALDVLPNDDVMISCHTQSKLIIIDKKTKKVKWESAKDIRLAHQHDPTTLENGNILVFDNGLHRKNSLIPCTRVLEIDKVSNSIVWEYMETNPCTFYGGFISGAQRLPNGNTLICVGPKGRFFEVTKEGEVVWEYINPFFDINVGIPARGRHNMVFRAHRYGLDYPGLKGKRLNPEKYEMLNRLYGPIRH
ncbi:MAG: aryl-sulfate sulfotransferase [Sedimentisphaerales bacterium]